MLKVEPQRHAGSMLQSNVKPLYSVTPAISLTHLGKEEGGGKGRRGDERVMEGREGTLNPKPLESHFLSSCTSRGEGEGGEGGEGVRACEGVV